MHRIRSETPYFRDVGINAMRVEVIQHGWATSGLSILPVTRMMSPNDPQWRPAEVE